MIIVFWLWIWDIGIGRVFLRIFLRILGFFFIFVNGDEEVREGMVLLKIVEFLGYFCIVIYGGWGKVVCFGVYGVFVIFFDFIWVERRNVESIWIIFFFFVEFCYKWERYLRSEKKDLLKKKKDRIVKKRRDNCINVFKKLWLGNYNVVWKF